jgi:hypothetical protein
MCKGKRGYKILADDILAVHTFAKRKLPQIPAFE